MVSSGTFRPIYYLGCKASYATEIRNAINEVSPGHGRVCDLFAGTGAVALTLGSHREVTTIDIQEYSKILCSALLKPAKLPTARILALEKDISNSPKTREILRCFEPLIQHEHHCIDLANTGDLKPLVRLLEAQPIAACADEGGNSNDKSLQRALEKTRNRLGRAGLSDSVDTTVSRYFGGVYFSFRQAAILDAILSYSADETKRIRITLLAAALSTASQVTNTVGKQFAQPLQPRTKAGLVKPDLLRRVQRDRSIDVLSTFRTWLGRYSALMPAIGKPECLRLDYLDALREPKSAYSVIYADPPYTRDHYSRFYHVLETMCLRDNPTVARSNIRRNGDETASRGLYRSGRHQSPFCIRSEAPHAFESLFHAAHELGVPMVLSYSPHEAGDGTHPRVVSEKKIVEIARHYYRKVDIARLEGSTHNSFNRMDLRLKRRTHAELLFKCHS